MTTNPPPDARNARIYVATANVAVMDILSGREHQVAAPQQMKQHRQPPQRVSDLRHPGQQRAAAGEHPPQRRAQTRIPCRG